MQIPFRSLIERRRYHHRLKSIVQASNTLQFSVSIPRLAVCHVHFYEVWPDLVRALHNINPDEIWITTDCSNEEIEGMQLTFPTANVIRVENRGRDAFPLVHLAQLGVFDNPSIVWKLHTKRSKQNLRGDLWRKELLFAVSGSRKIADYVYGCLTTKSVAMLGNDQYTVALRAETIEEHFGLFSVWWKINGKPVQTQPVKYVAGSIFACNSEVLLELKHLKLDRSQFFVENSIGVGVGRILAWKLYLLQFFQFSNSISARRIQLDATTRPLSQETCAIEPYLGSLASIHGGAFGVFQASRDED